MDKIFNELFDNNTDNMFLKLFGSIYDKNGVLYREVYCNELVRLKYTFNLFIKQHIIHGFEITRDALVAWILYEFAGNLGRVNTEGCCNLAYDLYKQINGIR